jgi:hypothetical protein
VRGPGIDAGVERHLVTLYVLDHVTVDGYLGDLARALGGGTVSFPDANGMLEIELSADTREQALARVRDAIAAAGADDHLTFPGTTGTDFLPRGRRAAAPDEQPDPEEPLHLEGGSPHDNRPSPSDEEA